MSDLNIETGKCYETRDGHRAYVVYRLDDELMAGLVRVPITQTPQYELWNEDGRCNPNKDYPHDLISEWKEPRKGEVWVNVYMAPADGRVWLDSFETKDSADNDDEGGRIACIGPIPWTEGQGLDGEGSE